MYYFNKKFKLLRTINHLLTSHLLPQCKQLKHHSAPQSSFLQKRIPRAPGFA